MAPGSRFRIPSKESHRVTQHTIRLGMHQSFGVAGLVLPTLTRVDMERPNIAESCMERARYLPTYALGSLNAQPRRPLHHLHRIFQSQRGMTEKGQRTKPLAR
jgi:hypothetical protein